MVGVVVLSALKAMKIPIPRSETEELLSIFSSVSRAQPRASQNVARAPAGRRLRARRRIFAQKLILRRF